MRYFWLNLTLAILVACLFIVGCNDGRYSNPSSPPATTTEWRSITATEFGGTFDLSDIGIYISIPAGAIPSGAVYSYDVRGFPPGVPLLPSGPALVRLGTFEFSGQNITFNRPIEVRFMIAERKSPGINSSGYRLNDDLKWEFDQSAPILADGLHAIMQISRPGIYGSFESVPLHVEATVSDATGPIPLSVGFKAIVSGGHPPYSIFWDFGDGTDPSGGPAVAHLYTDPGDYTAVVSVQDSSGHTATDWINVTAYWQSSPPIMP